MNPGIYGSPKNGRRKDYFFSQNSRILDFPCKVVEGQPVYFDFAFREISGTTANIAQFKFNQDVSGAYLSQAATFSGATTTSAQVTDARMIRLDPFAIVTGYGVLMYEFGRVTWSCTGVSQNPAVVQAAELNHGIWPNLTYAARPRGEPLNSVRIVLEGALRLAKDSRFSIYLPEGAN